MMRSSLPPFAPDVFGPDAIILVNLSGRGDKGVQTAGDWFGLFDEGAVQS